MGQPVSLTRNSGWTSTSPAFAFIREYHEKSSMRNPRRNEGMQMQLWNTATRFRVLVSLSLSATCYIKNRIRCARLLRAFFLSFCMPCLWINNMYIVLWFMRIHIPSVLELPPVLRILHKYKKRDLCRNLYKRITFYCTIIIKVTKSNLFIIEKFLQQYTWYFWESSLYLNRLLSRT